MRLRLLILSALLLSLLSAAVPAVAGKSISVLFASGSFVGRTTLDEKLREQLRQNGIDLQVDTCFYKELDLARLSRCNLLIMTYAPTLGANDAVREFHSAMQPILDYVEGGGGLIVMGDDNYESYKVLNEFLSQMDAEILPESPVDASKLYQQQAYLRHWYCSTENISRHPVTDGIKSVWYPMADAPDTGKATEIMRLGPSWSPLICANPSAYYYRTKLKEEGKRDHATPQPILGAREVGKGRVIAFSTRSVNYLEHPYHRMFEGLCIDRGDGLRLVQNMLTWVAQPAIDAGMPGGYVQPETKAEKPKIDPTSLKNLDYGQRPRRVQRRRVARVGGHQEPTADKVRRYLRPRQGIPAVPAEHDQFPYHFSRLP
ncbi:MAG: hypothetical protein HYX78_10775 [Armatimonadetes bacterium]|nr:hypothetical protein [Armatimonadota bacterium]